MLFSIGQLAKMYNISHDTLRYYDKINLLNPSVKKDNGYRYYTIREIESLEIILIAKQLEIPIKDIQEMLDKENEDSYIELFINHQNIIKSKIKHLNNLENQIQHSIDSIKRMKEHNSKNNNEITIKHITKEVIHFKQIDYGQFMHLNKDKKFILNIKNINNTLELDRKMLGIEMLEYSKFYNLNTEYTKKIYSGEYIVLTIKDTMDNIENSIYEAIHKVYEQENLQNNINIMAELMFLLNKKDNDNVYFVNIFIENIKNN